MAKIGRLYFVHPSTGERYFLRMLLMIVKGAQSYEDIRTFQNVVHSTFKMLSGTVDLKRHQCGPHHISLDIYLLPCYFSAILIMKGLFLQKLVRSHG